MTDEQVLSKKGPAGKTAPEPKAAAEAAQNVAVEQQPEAAPVSGTATAATTVADTPVADLSATGIAIESGADTVAVTPPPRRKHSRKFTRMSFWLGKWVIRLGLFLIPFFLIGAFLLWNEFKTSRWQARYLARIAKEATYSLADGPNPSAWFPKFGPYDHRLGYTRIPGITENMTKNGYNVTRQTRLSPRFLELANAGFFPPFREKSRAGITILDRDNTTIYSAYRPERVYDTFDGIPDVVVRSLLYIENREILDEQYPTRNPAVEWDRLGKAVLEKMKQVIHPDMNAPGGSTIATQLEKYRHSNEGRTSGIRDKLLQMGSASLRAYMYGEDTLATRRLIVLQYINSIPLAALPGYGEVNGLGDGLWAWYGLDFDELNGKLAELEQLGPNVDMTSYAEPFKQMMSLFIAHRRPSFYLLSGLSELDKLTNVYIDLLANDGIIPQQLAESSKRVQLSLRRAAPKPAAISFVQRKAANAIRTRLLQLMKFPQLYDLDQVDVTIRSTMDNRANEAVTEVLRQIKDEESVKRLGLSGARNLDRGDPSKVIYSLTLYERVGNANVLRVQTDNFDKPFSINEGTRLDLGSTAKLRTLVTYLDIIGEMYDKYSALDRKSIEAARTPDLDPLSSFVASALLENPKLTLDQLLEHAMERRYSASTGESFFTGGGVHSFVNFKREDNGRVPTMAEALTSSINLPFIRLMRDIARHYTYRLGVSLHTKRGAKADPMRLHFLQKFADQEGSHFMRQFYKKYRGLNGSELLNTLVSTSRASARHAAVMFRYVRPEATVEQMAKYLEQQIPSSKLSLGLVDTWYQEFAPGKFSLNDQGYLARVHPLELWLVKYLQENPGKGIIEALENSAAERQHVYQWLFKTPHVRAQDIRIRTLIEVEAFLEVHKQWKKMGYPFSSMVPSLASAIGSSGDRPAALAELVGIILNDGVRYPQVRLEELHFAAGTPYETVIQRADDQPGERVLKPEVARVLKQAMVNVVEKGTARRVSKTFLRSDGKAYAIGGKTGTGDHRHETFGAGGNVISSRVVNRTATFAFFIGDRFFGVITAHVPGAEAAKFDFTSALAAELLKILSKSLVPMIERSQASLSPIADESIVPVVAPTTASVPVVVATAVVTPTAAAVPAAPTVAAQTTVAMQKTLAPQKSVEEKKESEPTPAKTLSKKTPAPVKKPETKKKDGAPKKEAPKKGTSKKDSGKKGTAKKGPSKQNSKAKDGSKKSGGTPAKKPAAPAQKPPVNPAPKPAPKSSPNLPVVLPPPA